ncbi:MAG UNVERIFIED_CONTAM: hypothetical protein MIN83_20470, partial [Paenibacillus polymyxa]
FKILLYFDTKDWFLWRYILRIAQNAVPFSVKILETCVALVFKKKIYSLTAVLTIYGGILLLIPANSVM